MLRDAFTEFCQSLPAATDKYLSIDVDVVETREKAVLVESMTGIHAKQVWIPKSQLASRDRGKTFGLGLAIKRSWIARQRLWWMVN